MKKITALSIAVLLVFSMTACGGKSKDPAGGQGGAPAVSESVSQGEPGTEQDDASVDPGSAQGSEEQQQGTEQGDASGQQNPSDTEQGDASGQQNPSDMEQGDASGQQNPSDTEQGGDDSQNQQGPAQGAESGNEDESAAAALELLTTVWNSYGEDEKFAVAGGDMSEEHTTMDAPGIFDLADAEAVDTTLGLPAASLERIDGAASLVHMMNANTFTCGSFHLKEGEEAQALADEIRDNLRNRQWMCGFPDRLVVAEAGGCVVSFFGEQQITATFLEKLSAAYPETEVLCDEALTA